MTKQQGKASDEGGDGDGQRQGQEKDKGQGHGDARVYIVRHGSAEDDHPMGDGARALTVEGRQEFRALAEELGHKLRLRAIATSPLVRAVQTAEILSAPSGTDQVVVRGELSADRATGQSVAKLAHELGPGWALVGHNPSLAGGLALLLGLDEEPRFRKGAIAAVRPPAKAGGPWTLDWVISPGRKKRQEL